jgi:hypothetical protein
VPHWDTPVRQYRAKPPPASRRRRCRCARSRCCGAPRLRFLRSGVPATSPSSPPPAVATLPPLASPYHLVRVCLRDVCLPSACRPRACLRRPRRCASSSRRSCSIGSSWARRPSTMRCVTAALTSQRLCTSSTDSEARWAHTWMRSSSWRLCPILTPRRSTTWERACPTSSPRCAPRSRRLVTFGAWSGR